MRLLLLALSLLVATPAYSAATLIGSWSLAGSRNSDLGDGNTLTATGSISFTTIGGKACASGFGFSNYLGIPAAVKTAVAAAHADFLFEADVYFTGPSYGGAVFAFEGGSTGCGGTKQNFLGIFGGGQIGFESSNTAGGCVDLNNASGPSQNTWHTLQYYGTASGGRIYLDGVSIANDSANHDYGSGAVGAFKIGASHGGTPIQGYIANVRLWNTSPCTGGTCTTPTPSNTPTPAGTLTNTPTRTITTTVTPTPVACATGRLRIQQFGDSFQLGANCDAAEVGTVGARADVINTLRFTHNINAEFVSSTGNYGGILECNYTNAISAQTTTVQKNNFAAQLASGLTAPNSIYDVVFLGGGTAGEILGESSGTISSNWNDMMDLAWAQDEDILVLLINPAWNPSYSYTTTYDAYVTSKAYGLASGKPFWYYDPVATLGQNQALYVCPGDFHPNRLAQVIMGQGLADALAQYYRNNTNGRAISGWSPFPFWRRR